MGASKLVIITTIIAISLLISRPATSQEVEDEREFSYVPGSDNGPENWGELHEEWALCGNGQMQSPIDICDERVKVDHNLGDLVQTYHPSDAVMKNRGHDIMVQWQDGAGGLWLNEKEYALKQAHWHSPSEHTINGSSYCLELHLVHESADKEIAVVGILYKNGPPDPFLSELEGPIKDLARGENEVNAGVVDPREIIERSSTEYYRYMGSLTTPPCTEGVVWTVVRKVHTVSRRQVRLLRAAVHDGFEKNARPTQPINGRLIALYKPLEVQYSAGFSSV